MDTAVFNSTLVVEAIKQFNLNDILLFKHDQLF